MSARQPGGDVVDSYLTIEVDDAALWPTVRDRKGNAVRSYRPDPAAVQTAVRRAREMRRYDIGELAEAPSHDEIAEVIAQGARHRAELRDLEDLRHQHGLDQQRKQIVHDAQVADDQREHDNHVRAAQRRRDRATDPTTTLVRLSWAEKHLPGLGLVPAVFALVAGAFNVFDQLTRIDPGTAAINWAVEPLYTFPLVVILLAQMLGALPKPDFSRGPKAAFRTNRYLGMEVGLTLVAVVLNVVPHWLPAGHWSGDLVWLVVPSGLAFSAYLVPRLVTDIRQALREWSTEASDTAENPSENGGLSTVSDLHRENPRAGFSGEAENRPESPARTPARYGSKERARDEFWRLVEAGELDPATEKVNAIAKRIGTRWENARDFLAEWRETTASAA